MDLISIKKIAYNTLLMLFVIHQTASHHVDGRLDRLDLLPLLPSRIRGRLEARYRRRVIDTRVYLEEAGFEDHVTIEKKKAA